MSAAACRSATPTLAAACRCLPLPAPACRSATPTPAANSRACPASPHCAGMLIGKLALSACSALLVTTLPPSAYLLCCMAMLVYFLHINNQRKQDNQPACCNVDTIRRLRSLLLTCALWTTSTTLASTVLDVSEWPLLLGLFILWVRPSVSTHRLLVAPCCVACCVACCFACCFACLRHSPRGGRFGPRRAQLLTAAFYVTIVLYPQREPTYQSEPPVIDGFGLKMAAAVGSASPTPSGCRARPPVGDDGASNPSAEFALKPHSYPRADLPSTAMSSGGGGRAAAAAASEALREHLQRTPGRGGVATISRSSQPSGGGESGDSIPLNAIAAAMDRSQMSRMRDNRSSCSSSSHAGAISPSPTFLDLFSPSLAFSHLPMQASTHAPTASP